MRIKLELDISSPLTDGFWWTSKSGEEKWATIKYERMSDVCYSCGRLGHTSISCSEGIVMSENKPEFPKYGPWMMGT